MTEVNRGTVMICREWRIFGDSSTAHFWPDRDIGEQARKPSQAKILLFAPTPDAGDKRVEGWWYIGRDDRPRPNDVKKALLTLAGVIALLLGIVGIALPGLPTTPFVLLAAYCFARASPRLHAWLTRNRMFGSMISDWERNRSLTRRTKLIAIVAMIGMVLVSVWQLADRLPLQLAIALLGLIGGIVIWKIPTTAFPSGK